MKLLYLLTLAVWGSIPLTVILIAFMFPSLLLSQPKFMLVLPILWALSCVILFALMLFTKDNSSIHTMYSLMGLTCTFVLGLPAIAFSTLPLFGSPVDFLESINPAGNEVDLASPKDRAQVGSRNLHLIGIDVSKSFVKGQDDPRISQIMQVLNSVFIDNPSSPASGLLHPADVVQVYMFGGEVEFVGDNKDDGAGKLTRRKELLDGLKNEFSRGPRLDPGRTDLLKFLDRVRQEIKQSEGQQFEDINVYIFSDLMQSKSDSTTDDIDSVMQDFGNTIRRNGVEFFAFWARPYEERKEARSANGDVARYLRSDLEEYWSELVLEDYAQATPEKKLLLTTGLYREELITDTLYLKYFPDPGWRALRSRLVLPRSDETNTLFFGLRSSSKESSVRVKFARDTADGFALGFSEYEEFARYARKAGEQNPLGVELAEHQETLRDAHCELLIGVPSESILYRVPLVVMPSMREASVLALKFVIGILHLLPLLIAIQIYRDQFGSKPTAGNPPTSPVHPPTHPDIPH